MFSTRWNPDRVEYSEDILNPHNMGMALIKG